jgi:hypothetical protein
LDVILRQRELAIIETEHKLEEIARKLRVTKENNLELHDVIFEIDYQREELRGIICIERKSKNYSCSRHTQR